MKKPSDSARKRKRPQPPPLVYRPPDAAVALNVSLSQLYVMLETGEFGENRKKPIKIGKRASAIPAHWITELIEKRENAAASKTEV